MESGEREDDYISLRQVLAFVEREVAVGRAVGGLPSIDLPPTAPLGAIRAGFSLRVAEGAAGCSVRNIDLRLSAGNRRQSRSVAVLRGCEGPRPDARLPVIRLRPRAFLPSLGAPGGVFDATPD
jgi:hypothetical protein